MLFPGRSRKWERRTNYQLLSKPGVIFTITTLWAPDVGILTGHYNESKAFHFHTRPVRPDWGFLQFCCNKNPNWNEVRGNRSEEFVFDKQIAMTIVYRSLGCRALPQLLQFSVVWSQSLTLLQSPEEMAMGRFRLGISGGRSGCFMQDSESSKSVEVGHFSGGQSEWAALVYCQPAACGLLSASKQECACFTWP